MNTCIDNERHTFRLFAGLAGDTQHHCELAGESHFKKTQNGVERETFPGARWPLRRCFSLRTFLPPSARAARDTHPGIGDVLSEGVQSERFISGALSKLLWVIAKSPSSPDDGGRSSKLIKFWLSK